MRTYNEPIEVRRGLVAGTEGPAQFLWRNRLWVVRDVQTRWLETAPWWEGSQARALRGDDQSDQHQSDQHQSDQHQSDQHDGDLLAEEEVWRVLAADGRQGRHGVYELTHASGTGQWRLRAVQD